MNVCGRCEALLDPGKYYCAYCNFPQTPRKITHIATLPAHDRYFRVLIALADDGTLWQIIPDEEDVWRSLPSLPQPEA